MLGKRRNGKKDKKTIRRAYLLVKMANRGRRSRTLPNLQLAGVAARRRLMPVPKGWLETVGTAARRSRAAINIHGMKRSAS